MSALGDYSKLRLRRRSPLTIVDDPRALVHVRAGWDDLASAAATLPTQQFAWTAAAARSLVGRGRLTVALVGSPERPDAIAPLVERRGRVELLGSSELCEPADVLVRDADSLDALARGLAGMHVPLLLKRIPATSPTTAALATAFRPIGVAVTRAAAAHPTIDLRMADWTAPERRLSSRRAQDLRRARRRAEAAGDVDTELLAPSSAELPDLLEDAFRIEAASWKGRSGTALVEDAPRAEFFRAYAAAAARRGELRIAFLRVGGKRVAMQIAVEWQRRLWLLKIGYDEAHARCSPGMLLLADSVARAARDDLDAVQLLGTVEAWTRAWTGQEEQTVTVAAYPPRLRSVRAALGDARQVVGSRRGAPGHAGTAAAHRGEPVPAGT